MSYREVWVINHGIGNIRSVTNALEHIGYNVKLATAKDDLEAASVVILPGVGNFGGVMNELKSRQLFDPIQDYILKNNPFLGICVGMQVLFEGSEEKPESDGFKLLQGRLQHLSALDSSGVTPSIGWHSLNNQQNKQSAGGLEQAYFVHNYFASGVKDSELLSTYSWRGHEIPAHVAKGRVHGVQFHPEKSRHEGLKFLESLILEITK